MDTTGEIRRKEEAEELARQQREDASHSSRPTAVEKRPSDSVVETAEDSGYTVYGEFVKDELEAQDKRKASFEQRGLAVITTSGTLVTLLLARRAVNEERCDVHAPARR